MNLSMLQSCCNSRKQVFAERMIQAWNYETCQLAKHKHFRSLVIIKSLLYYEHKGVNLTSFVSLGLKIHRCLCLSLLCMFHVCVCLFPSFYIFHVYGYILCNDVSWSRHRPCHFIIDDTAVFFSVFISLFEVCMLAQ